MRNLVLFVHLAAAIFWMGGMAFMVLALRPVLHAQLQPPARLPLVRDVLGRFLVIVLASVLALLASGAYLIATHGASAPPGWNAMAALGLVMFIIYGVIHLRLFPGLRSAVQAGDWPAGGAVMARITLLVKINLGLGWLAIAAVMLWR